jgi:ABC-type dipeptide/oligopeptide/nickel transport system permease component
VQGIVLWAAAGLLVVNLLLDMAYAYMDPRIRYG